MERALGAVFSAALVAVTLVLPPASAAGAESRTGRIGVRAQITLQFPNPGEYAGAVKHPRATMRKNAISRHGPASRRQRARVLRKAPRKCARERAESGVRDGHRGGLVRVFHLSRPRFLIGETELVQRDSLNPYTVFGPEPPTGDRVRSITGSQLTRVRDIFHRWEVVCKGARVTRPYPF